MWIVRIQSIWWRFNYQAFDFLSCCFWMNCQNKILKRRTCFTNVAFPNTIKNSGNMGLDSWGDLWRRRTMGRLQGPWHSKHGTEMEGRDRRWQGTGKRCQPRWFSGLRKGRRENTWDANFVFARPSDDNPPPLSLLGVHYLWRLHSRGSQLVW